MPLCYTQHRGHHLRTSKDHYLVPSSRLNSDYELVDGYRIVSRMPPDIMIQRYTYEPPFVYQQQQQHTPELLVIYLSMVSMLGIFIMFKLAK